MLLLLLHFFFIPPTIQCVRSLCAVLGVSVTLKPLSARTVRLILHHTHTLQLSIVPTQRRSSAPSVKVVQFSLPVVWLDREKSVKVFWLDGRQFFSVVVLVAFRRNKPK